MRLILKAMGINSDLKINFFPLSQTVIPEPSLEVTPIAIVNDTSRDAAKPSEPTIPENKSEPDSSAAAIK